jgi:phosphatidylethanolamine-binding protein
MFKFFLSFAIFFVVFHSGASNDVQSKFIENGIVPDVLESLPEIETLKVSYPSGVCVNLGNVLTPTQVKDEPTVEYEGEAGAFYTLLMTGELAVWKNWFRFNFHFTSKDPDAPTRSNPAVKEVRHWLVVNIKGKNMNSGKQAFEYIGSGPPKDTGLHRYVFLLFKQSNGKIDFDARRVTDRSLDGRLSTSTRQLISDFNLQLVAGNFYQAEYDDYVPILYEQLSGKPKRDQIA